MLLLRTVVAALVPMAVLIAAANALAGQSIGLVAFLIVVVGTASLGAFLWRLHSLYLVIDRHHRQLRGLPPAGHPGPLTRLAGLSVWSDKLVRALLGGALAANLIVFAYVSDKYASLPPFLPLHYSATGDVDRLGTPLEVFMMPSIGVVVLLTNLLFAAVLHRRERLASLLLIGATIFVQFLLLVATANIVSRA
jgi:hypothetical protein